MMFSISAILETYGKKVLATAIIGVNGQRHKTFREKIKEYIEYSVLMSSRTQTSEVGEI